MSAIKIVAKNDSPLADKMPIKKKDKESKKRKLSKKEAKRSKRLDKKFNKDSESRSAEKFMHTKLRNIVLLNETNYSSFTGRFSRKKFGLGNKGTILVNAGHGMMLSMQSNVVKELTKIKYIVINVNYDIHEDGTYDAEFGDMEEPSMFMHKTVTIPNLNKLCHYFIERIGMLESVALYQSGEGWYSYVEVNETFAILYQDGSSEKLTGQEFISKYNFYKYCGYKGDIES